MDIRRPTPADATLYRSLRLRALRDHPDEPRAKNRHKATVVGMYEGAGFRSFGVEPDAVRCGGRSWAKNHMQFSLATAP